MKAIKNSNVGKALLFFPLICLLVGSIDAMQPEKKSVSHSPLRRQLQQGQARQLGLESVWVQTADGQILEIPKWQIDQMKVLQMLFVHQKGKNSKKNPVDAVMISYENLILMQKALNIAGNLGEFTLFCNHLMPEQKGHLVNAAFAVEAIGLASLLAEETFSPEIQEKLGATVPGIIEPVAGFLEMKIKDKKNLVGHTGLISCVAFSPDGQYIVSGSKDTNLILWNGITGEQINILAGHGRRVRCVEFSPNGQYIVSGSDGLRNNLIVWNGKTGQQIQVLRGHHDNVTCGAFSFDGNYFVSGSADNNLILWDTTTWQQINILQGHNDGVICVAFSVNGDIVSGSSDTNLILWKRETGERISILVGHTGVVECVAFSPDGEYIVSGADEDRGNLILWNKAGEKIKVLYGHQDRVNCVAFSPGGEFIISGSEGDIYNLIAWDGKTGEQINILQGNPDSVTCVAFSFDAHYMISGSRGDQDNLILWNMKARRMECVGDRYGVNHVAFSPKGDCIIYVPIQKATPVLLKLVDPTLIDFIKTELTLSQARFLYRLYLAKLNKVPVVIDEHDQDYATYLSLSHHVRNLIDKFLPFSLASTMFTQAVEQKKNEYKALFVGKTLNQKIALVEQAMRNELNKNSVEYKAFQELLREFEMEFVGAEFGSMGF